MARILLEPMEIGNQMFAFVETKMYVGSMKEWVEVIPQADGTRKYLAERDDAVLRDLYLAYLAKNVEVGMDKYIAKHLKQRSQK